MKKYAVILVSIFMICVFTMQNFADGWTLVGNNWRWQNDDGSFAIDTIKKSENKSYYLDSDGNEVFDYLAEINDNFYYFDDNGAMVTNTWVAIDPSNIEDAPFDSDAYFMYFQNNGRAIKGENGKIRTIDGKSYMFNEAGIMMIGWITEDGEHLDHEESDEWYSDDATYYAYEDGSLAEGWVAWTDGLKEETIIGRDGEIIDEGILYFYFRPNNHRKMKGTTENINNNEYAFAAGNGRMLSSWQKMEENYGSFDYIRLPYIESNKTQYIDTLYNPSKKSKVIIKFNYIEKDSGGDIFGFEDSSVTPNTYEKFKISVDNNGELDPKYGHARMHNYLTPSSDSDFYGKDMYIVVDGYGYKVMDSNGSLMSCSSGSAYRLNTGMEPQGDSDFTAFIFKANNDGEEGQYSTKTKYRLYQLTIRNNGRVVRDFVPCKITADMTNAYGERSSAGEIGLWDRKQNKFYPKKVGDDFTTNESAEIPLYAQGNFSDYNLNDHREYNKYYQDEDDGSLFKEGWLYQVPTSIISQEDHDDENKDWFYVDKKGRLIIDKEKKINNKTYLFDKNGIMQTSLIIKYATSSANHDGYNTPYAIERVDLSETTGEEFIKEGIYYIKDLSLPYDGVEPEKEIIDPDNAGGSGLGVLGRENGFNMKYSNGVQYIIDYYGDDGAKITGKNMEIEFADGTYLFTSDNKGALSGFVNDKYYVNGFLCKASDDIGYGILVDYSAFNLSNMGYQRSAGKFRHLKPEFYNYNNYICEKTGTDENTKGEAIASAHSDLNKYYVHYPLISVITKGYTDILESTNLSYNKSNAIYVVDRTGKRKDKGSYKDKDGNYWLVDKNKELVGIFEVPVKWQKINGVETPCFKSTFLEIDSDGESKEKDKYMPFFTKDEEGHSEMDYVLSIDDEYIANAVVGEYNMNIN